MTSNEFVAIILELFNHRKNNSILVNTLKENDFLHLFFNESYMQTLTSTDYGFLVFKIVEKEENIIEYYLETNDGNLYKLEISFSKKWFLKSFLFQCPGCFGDDDSCGVCGGSGWGVL